MHSTDIQDTDIHPTHSQFVSTDIRFLPHKKTPNLNLNLV